jgi:hypothetical protein
MGTNGVPDTNTNWPTDRRSQNQPLTTIFLFFDDIHSSRHSNLSYPVEYNALNITCTSTLLSKYINDYGIICVDI